MPASCSGRNLAKRLKTRVGKRVVVMAQDANGKLAERAFQVVGIYAASQQAEDEFAFTGIRTAQAMTGIGDDISEIAFDAQSDEGLPTLLDAISKPPRRSSTSSPGRRWRRWPMPSAPSSTNSS